MTIPRPLRSVVVPFVLTRIALALVALAAGSSFGPGTRCEQCDLSTIPLVNVLSRWDTGAYLDIAQHGYSYTPGTRSNVTFSPLLPLVMRIGALGSTNTDALLIVGLIASNVALLIALAQVHDLTERILGAEAAGRAVLYLLVFPTTVFFSAAYPGSLFIAFAIGALVAAQRERWPAAAVFAALAALARPFGVFVLVPLAVEAFRRYGPRWRWTAAMAVAAPAIAFTAWQLHLIAVSGDPFVYAHAQEAYRRHFAPPWEGVLELADPRFYQFPWFVGGIFALATVLTAVSWRVMPATLAVYGTTLLVVTASSGTLTSFPRYSLTLVPMFVTLAAIVRHRAIHVVVLIAFALLATLLTAMYATWYWIG